MDERLEGVAFPPTATGATAEGQMLRADLVREMVARRERGEGTRQIARELAVDRKTVRRWLRLGGWQPRQGGARPRALDPYLSFVERRGPEVNWNGVVTSQEFLAAAVRSRTSRGTPLSAEVRGSMSELITRHPVDFPAPCSPFTTRMGHGRPGRSAATRKARISVQPWWSTLKKGRSSSRLPPRSGSGSACEPRVRRNFATGRSTTRQP